MRHLRRARWYIAYLPLRLALPLGGAATDRDVRRQIQPRLDLPLPDSYTSEELNLVLAHLPFRTVFYHRLRKSGSLSRRLVAMVLSRIYKGEPLFSIGCDDIGPGLVLLHGIATLLGAQKIGVDCQLSQHVTLGYNDRGGPPVLGDRVRIGAKAVVLGPITIGDDAVVGAGAVVVRDVPPGAVVGGVPAKVLAGAANRYGAPNGRSDLTDLGDQHCSQPGPEHAPQHASNVL